MTHGAYSRREVLGGLTAGTALLPLVEAGRASAAPYPRRIVIFMLTNGLVQGKFFPQPSGPGRDLSTAAFPESTAALESYRSDLIFIRGVTPQNYIDSVTVGKTGGGHHSYNTLFTGTRGKPYNSEPRDRVATSKSIDQAIADDIAKSVPLPLRSLHLGMLRFGSEFHQVCFHRGQDAPIVPECNPRQVLDKFFAAGPGGSATLDRIRAERRSVLDLVGRDLARFAERLGGEDRLKVDAHLQSVREIEKQIAGVKAVTCSAPPVSSADPYSINNYPQTLSTQMDLVTAAFRCDLTRVATIQLSNSSGDRPGMFFPWLAGVSERFHHYAHSGGPGKVKIDTWFMEQLAGLLKRFRAIPEGNGTMLDNSVVLFANHMEEGSTHRPSNLPWVLAGRCGGYLRTGQLLAPTSSASTTNRVFIGLANAMGLPITTFGDDAYGSDPTPGMAV